MVLTWKLKDGPADLEGSWSPDKDLWEKALAVQEGSEEAANRLLDEYNSLIASTVTKLSRMAK
jgi:DNA-directed RNA polymerase specialized sigma subunit